MLVKGMLVLVCTTPVKVMAVIEERKLKDPLSFEIWSSIGINHKHYVFLSLSLFVVLINLNSSTFLSLPASMLGWFHGV